LVVSLQLRRRRLSDPHKADAEAGANLRATACPRKDRKSMHFGKYLAASGAAAVFALTLVAAQTQPAHAASNPILIEHCFVTQPKPLSKLAGGTQIVYVNKGTKRATKITFGVGYRNAENNFYRRVTDVGSFTPGTQVDHHFDLFNDVTYAGKQTSSCSALSVKWSDGTTWSQ
jgi:hypothetical protein